MKSTFLAMLGLVAALGVPESAIACKTVSQEELRAGLQKLIARHRGDLEKVRERQAVLAAQLEGKKPLEAGREAVREEAQRQRAFADGLQKEIALYEQKLRELSEAKGKTAANNEQTGQKRNAC